MKQSNSSCSIIQHSISQTHVNNGHVICRYFITLLHIQYLQNKQCLLVTQIHDIKAYTGSRGVSAMVHYLSTRCKQVVYFILVTSSLGQQPSTTTEKEDTVPLNQSRHSWKKFLAPAKNWTLHDPGHKLLSVPTTLS